MEADEIEALSELPSELPSEAKLIGRPPLPTYQPGVAAATAIEVPTAQPQQQNPVLVFECSASGCTPVPIDVAVSGAVYLALYGTGIRNLSSLANVQVTVGGLSVPVHYAGPQPGFPGLDQLNVTLPATLIGMGDVNVVVTVDGQVSNTVFVNIQ